MRQLLAATAFTAVLTAQVLAHASSATDALPATARIARCPEQPMSLAMAIAEYEASRALNARSLVSDGQPVVATPASPIAEPVGDDAPAPFSPTPRACLSPDDPGCHVSVPPPCPHRVHLGSSVHAVVLTAVDLSWPPATMLSTLPSGEVLGTPRDAHARGAWRPPAN